MDQIVSDQPGLIPQMSGFLTNLRIWGAKVFVDHVSDYVYVALMRDLTLDETLLHMAKRGQNGINKKLAFLKKRLPICMSCIFGQYHR